MEPRCTHRRGARHPITSRPGWPRAARAGAAALLVFVAVALAHSVDVAERLRDAQAWMDGLGAWGPIAFIAIYVATTLAAGPGLPFTLVAPALFGPWAGVLIMVA